MPPLAWRGPAGRDQPNPVSANGPHHHDLTVKEVPPQRCDALFGGERVRPAEGVRIRKDPHGVGEVDAMLPAVGFSRAWIPLARHEEVYAQLYSVARGRLERPSGFAHQLRRAKVTSPAIPTG